MTPTETIRLCKTVRAVAPAQKFEPETPDAWWVVLKEFTLDECLAALALVAQERAFIAPADLITQIRATRRKAAQERRAAVEQNPALVPAASPDDPAAYAAAIKAGRFVEPAGRVLAKDRADALIGSVAKALPAMPS